jgi:P2X purinoceptor 4
LYVVLFTIVVDKGYQIYDPVTGTVVPKVKGTASSLRTNLIYDNNDLIIPPTEENALFVTTNLVATNQSRGECQGDDKAQELCSKGCTSAPRYTFNGYKTGACYCPTCTFCRIKAWCPLEDDAPRFYNVMQGTEDWSVFVKVNAEFPEFNVKRQNAAHGLVKGKNQFTLSELVSLAGSDWNQVKYEGAILLMRIAYDCDLNKGKEHCEPELHFDRLDPGNGTFSGGFNVRTVVMHEDGSRQVTKRFGIRVLFSVSGQAGRFSIVVLTTTMGAGLALLGVSTLICDFLLSYVLPNKHKYNAEKFEEVDEQSGGARISMLSDSDVPPAAMGDVQQQHATQEPYYSSLGRTNRVMSDVLY